MKKISGKILRFLLAAAMFCCMNVNAFAAESSVVYEGGAESFVFSPGSGYSQTDLFDSFKNVMPGDRIRENITVQNDSREYDYINIYLRAETSEKNDADMLDFLSQLHMRVYDWNNLIYEASPDQLDGLKGNVLLGTYRPGESSQLAVELEVPIDMGDTYANRIGEVKWVFTAEGFDDPTPPEYEKLTVQKVWQDDGINRPSSAKVVLLRNGEAFETVELNQGCNWKYTWTELASGYSWTVVEKDVPAGYEAAYTTVTDTVTITNKKTGITYGDLQVIKAWSDRLINRPSSISVTLFSGETAVETVTLSAMNKWSHTWKNLPSNGNWTVVETAVPNGYTPMYSRHGNTIVITNVSSLLQTGQLNWPVFVLLGAAAVLFAAGLFMKCKKRKQNV